MGCIDKHHDVRKRHEHHDCDRHDFHKRNEHHKCYCNEAFAPGERMFVCREKHHRLDADDRFECRRIPNCVHRRRCCFCDIFRF
ncbi:MAG TPA: hypothetical protein PLD48_01105 [Bacillota bacterium]|nr:hypothetical protein [Bacillota bacterium]HOK68312.1 hypothetical protein [Bacillota bacterium]HPP85482.1 hypothetical protein [Bacillota bacterium]